MNYFDNAATTPLDPRVIQVMVDVLENQFGNALGKYYRIARDAQGLIEESRKSVAQLINAEEKGIVFTSGSTESNNFIIKGLAERFRDRKNKIITSAIEHKSILNTCAYLEEKGFKIEYLPCRRDGSIDVSKIDRLIDEETIVVSLMWVNNETGIINDLEKVSLKCKQKGVFFHSDLTQGIGKIPIDVSKIKLDFASISAHKIYGPKGIGAAYIGNDALGIKHKINPLLHGGKQEWGLRGGTHSNHNIIGFGMAAKIACEEMEINRIKIEKIESDFVSQLRKVFGKSVQVIGDLDSKVPGILNIRIEGFNNEMFLKAYEDQLACSTGSACAFGDPSHVIKAMMPESDFGNHLRISFGKFNSDSKILISSLLHFKNKFMEEQ